MAPMLLYPSLCPSCGYVSPWRSKGRELTETRSRPQGSVYRHDEELAIKEGPQSELYDQECRKAVNGTRAEVVFSPRRKSRTGGEGEGPGRIRSVPLLVWKWGIVERLGVA